MPNLLRLQIIEQDIQRGGHDSHNHPIVLAMQRQFLKKMLLELYVMQKGAGNVIHTLRRPNGVLWNENFAYRIDSETTTLCQDFNKFNVMVPRIATLEEIR